MPTLAAIAPIIWAKWGNTFLEALRQEARDAADGLAFRALNSEAGVRMLLVVCTTDPAQIRDSEEALPAGVAARSVDWERYSIAEMVFKTEKGSGLGRQEQQDENGGISLVLCATRPSAVRTIQEMFDLPA